MVEGKQLEIHSNTNRILKDNVKNEGDTQTYGQTAQRSHKVSFISQNEKLG
jgi:hypothetical protein